MSSDRPPLGQWNPQEPLEDSDSPLFPWLCGPAITVLLYQVVPHLPVDQAAFDRSFRSHWTTPFAVGCFLIAACILFRKGLRLIAEYRSLGLGWSDVGANEPSSAVDRAARLARIASTLPASLRRTRLVRRVADVCEQVTIRRSTASLDQTLQHQSAAATAAVGASHSPVRALTAAIPLIGLLGSLATFAATWGAAKPADATVTGALASAFAPLAASLCLTVVLIVVRSLIEQAEFRALSHVDEIANGRLRAWIGAGVEPSPFAAAEVRAAENLLARTEEVVTWQTGVWQTALEAMRVRWLEAAERQQGKFAQALEQGMTASLAGHQDQLSKSGGELISGCRAVAHEMARAVEAIQQAGQQQQQRFAAQIGEVWERTHTDLSRARAEQATQSGEQVERLTRAIHGWHDDLTRASEAMKAQLAELKQQGAVLREIAAHEAELARLQATLRENLQAVRSVGTFEESIHSLNAAVHLLTSRARPHAA